jgi:cyclopropane fatty-acyl-phospholipid synthase-like methyltransferase
MKVFNFDHEPAYAELWDRCVYELLYDPEIFVTDFCALLEKYGITKDSEILDSCAGSGFPALDMVRRGYSNITCADLSDDQIELFKKKAQKENFSIESQKVAWLDIPKHFKDKKFKAIICKGSIWYASGGWNKDCTPDRISTLKALKDTLTAFYSSLEEGGVVYLDKFKDTELDHRDTVGIMQIGQEKKELIFYTHREPEKQIRRAQMIVKDIETGKEEGLPNVTYDLKGQELEDTLKEVGFKTIQKVSLPSEKTFDIWIAQK